MLMLGPAARLHVAVALGAEPFSPVIERQPHNALPRRHAPRDLDRNFRANLADQCPALLATDRIKQGNRRYVEQQTGRAAASIAGTVACRPGGSEADGDAQQLQVPPRTCLLGPSRPTTPT
jgi:hypothetical protein